VHTPSQSTGTVSSGPALEPRTLGFHATYFVAAYRHTDSATTPRSPPIPLETKPTRRSKPLHAEPDVGRKARQIAGMLLAHGSTPTRLGQYLGANADELLAAAGLDRLHTPSSLIVLRLDLAPGPSPTSMQPCIAD